MDFSFEGFFILIIFVAPGFLSSYLGEARRKTNSPKKSVFELVIMSMFRSLLIFMVLAFIASVFMKEYENFSDFVKAVLQGSTLTFLLNYFDKGVLYYSLWIFLTLVFAYVLSIVDPMEYIVELNLKRTGEFERYSFWNQLFRIVPGELDPPRTRTWAIISLKTGCVYRGIVAQYERNPKRDEPRLFWVNHATRWNTMEEYLGNAAGEFVNAVLLKYNDDINSIELWWD